MRGTDRIGRGRNASRGDGSGGPYLFSRAPARLSRPFVSAGCSGGGNGFARAPRRDHKAVSDQRGGGGGETKTNLVIMAPHQRLLPQA